VNKSESIGELAAALAKAQGAMGAAKKGAANPYFKSSYADLADIVAAIKEPLSVNGLAYAQTTDVSDSWDVSVETMLLHSSGQWISGTLTMKPTKSDPQGIGSCITYARRYGLQAMVGIPAEDDDANAASGNSMPTPEQAKRDAAILQPEKAASQRFRTAGASQLPKEHSEVPMAFRALVEVEAETVWTDDNERTEKAKALAMALKGGGMGDQPRKRLYELLTGQTSGTEMDPREVIVLHRLAGESQRLMAYVAWANDLEKP
jgi:hypothetical protein